MPFGMMIHNAPPGLLLTDEGHLLCKTEYEGHIYIVESGERYCGPDRLCIEVTEDCIDAARDRWEIGDAPKTSDDLAARDHWEIGDAPKTSDDLAVEMHALWADFIEERVNVAALSQSADAQVKRGGQ
jgi:hypothetical protein